MNTLNRMAAGLSAFALAAVCCLPATAAAQDRTDAAAEFETPVRIEANGQPISVTTGHSAPFVCDWDGDGTPDLLVGQFGSGKLRIYRNNGSVGKPAFGEFTYFDGTIPSG